MTAHVTLLLPRVGLAEWSNILRNKINAHFFYPSKQPHDFDDSDD